MNTTDKKFELARRLQLLTKDFLLTWNHPSSVFDGDVGISVDRVWDDNEQLEYLVTVSAGFPAPDSVRGLPWVLSSVESNAIVKVGATDRSGQFWLRGLPRTDYRLEIQALDFEVEVDEKFAFAHGAKKEQLSLDFHTAGLQGQLRVDVAGHLVLDIEVDLKIWNQCRLARFRIFDRQDVLLGQGFMGIYEIGSDKGCAFIDLDILDPSIREKSANCRLVVQPAAGLTKEDQEILQRSLDATADPISRDILQSALEALK